MISLSLYFSFIKLTNFRIIAISWCNFKSEYGFISILGRIKKQTHSIETQTHSIQTHPNSLLFEYFGALEMFKLQILIFCLEFVRKFIFFPKQQQHSVENIKRGKNSTPKTLQPGMVETEKHLNLRLSSHEPLLPRNHYFFCQYKLIRLPGDLYNCEVYIGLNSNETIICSQLN